MEYYNCAKKTDIGEAFWNVMSCDKGIDRDNIYTCEECNALIQRYDVFGYGNMYLNHNRQNSYCPKCGTRIFFIENDEEMKEYAERRTNERN